MTDNEIRESWNFSKMVAINIGSVTLSKEDVLAIDDFINRQKAEIERLENSLAISKKETKRYKALCQTIQSETVKGVAFMLRAMGAGRLAWDEDDEEICGFLTVDEIDNLLKEFMEGKPDGEPMQT